MSQICGYCINMSEICSWCINLSQIFEYSIEISRIIICCANVLIYDKYKEYYKTVKILQYDTDIAQIFVYAIEISQMFGYTIEISQILSCSTDLSHLFGCCTDLDYGLELSHIWLRHNCFTTPICVWNWCFRNIRPRYRADKLQIFSIGEGPGWLNELGSCIT